MTRGYLLLAVAVLFNGVANVLLKLGMRDAPAMSDATGTVKHYITSWPVVVGLILFAVNVIAYTQALAKLPLSVAYPIMVAMTGFIVISGSIVLFKETISLWQWFGFALIIGGIVCVTR